MSLEDILKTQYNRAKTNGWLEHFADAAAKHGHTTADLMAIASRESNMRNIEGDFRDGRYNGYSLMQLDIGSFPQWIEAGYWKDPALAIHKGAEVLAQKRAQIIKTSKQKQGKVRFSNGTVKSFTPRELSNADLRRVTVASYNCGGASYYHFSQGNDPDKGTTGKNYSKDVITRSVIFQKLLEADHVAPLNREPVSPLDQVDPSRSKPQDGNTVQDSISVEEVAQKVSNETVKRVTVKAVAKAGGPIVTLWGSGVHGKVLIILAALIILAVIGYETWRHWYRIKNFVIKRVKSL